jgi:hypothetical protein
MQRTSRLTSSTQSSAASLVGLESFSHHAKVARHRAAMRFSPSELHDLADAIERYCYYVEVGVSNKNIAPFRQSWVETVLCLLPPTKPTHLSDQYFQQLLEEAIDEMKADYVYSMHKAIMHYIVRSPVERRCGLHRCHIIVISFFGILTTRISCILSWRQCSWARLSKGRAYVTIYYPSTPTRKGS